MISFIQEGAMQEVVAVVEDAKVLGSCRSLQGDAGANSSNSAGRPFCGEEVGEERSF